MEEKIVYMVRHGRIQSNIDEVYSGRSGELLTEKGAKEALELGREMADWKIRAIYTSPLARTLQTAEILNRHIGARLIEEPDLIEMDLGHWTGLSKTEVANKYGSEYQTWWQNPILLKVPGMETLHEVQQRGIRALDKFLRAEGERVAAMVTHAAVIKSVLLYLNGLSLNAYHTFQVLNLSVHQITLKNGKAGMRVIRKGSGPLEE